jgi:hypothetical protein
MKRVLVAAIAALAVVLVVATLPARAQTVSAPQPANSLKVFVDVESVTVRYGTTIVVRGIIQGESTATEWYASPASSDTGAFASNCHRAALLAMEKPGRYLLEIQTAYSGSGTPLCRLTRAAP